MPKIVDHDAYRKEILTKSFDLFAERGYAALTMRELAEGLGVSTGTLYHYFPTKDDLFDGLMTHIMESEIQIAVSALPSRRDVEGGLVALFRYVDASSERIVKTQLLAIEYLKHRRDAGARPLRHNNEKLQQAVTKLTGIADPLVIQHVGAVIEGLLFAKELDREPVDFEAHARLIARLLKR